MPDYEDAQGNPLTPAEAETAIAAGQEVYEVVEDEVVDPPVTVPTVPAAAPVQPVAETPVSAASTAATRRTAPKGLLAVAAVVVIAIGGGLAYGMHNLGQQHTVEDAKVAVSSKKAAVSSAVESKVESKKKEAVSAKGDYLVGQACPDRAVEGAQWAGGDEPLPEYQLQTVGKTTLPAGFRERVAKRAKGEPREIVMLQLSDSRLGVYVSGTSVDAQSGKSTWWKVTTAITGDEPAVLGDSMGDGTDRDMRGACESVPEGRYLVMGQDQTEAPDAPTKLLMLKPAAGEDGTVYAVNADGTELLRLRVAQTPAEAREHSEGGDAASSSPVPSK